MTLPCRPSVLSVLAGLNVVVHAAALALAAVGMRPGSPLVGLPERLTYLSRFPAGWSLGWGSWMLCTLALVAFCAALAERLPEAPHTARLAVVVAVAGGAIDLFCDVLYITVLPVVASWGPAAERLFLAVEGAAFAGGLVVANGAYSIGTLLLTWCVRRRKGATPWITGVGCGVFLCGMLLVVAGLTARPRLAELATGPTIGLFCVWTVLVARSLRRPGSSL